MTHDNRIWLIVMLAVGLGSCGGDGDRGFDAARVVANEPQPTAPEPPPAARVVAGQFKDANVTGLSYVSGSQSGVTGPAGEFSCMSDQPVAFSIGAVQLGSSACTEAVTPLNLFADSTLDTPEVLNVVRFLLLLDDDGDPANGIFISDDVRAKAQTWAPVDFSAVDLGEELAPIVDALYVDQWPVLADENTARNHLQATAQCLFSGVYWLDLQPEGRRGPIGLLAILPVEVDGVALLGGSWDDRGGYGIAAAASSMRFGDITRMEFAEVSGQPEFRGRFISVNEFDGQWDGDRSFQGTRGAAAAAAAYRFVGFENGEAYVLDLLDDDQVSVTWSWMDRWDFGSDELVYRGAVMDGRFSAHGNDPDQAVEGSLDLDATPPVAHLTFTTTPYDSSPVRTTYGCRLN